MSQKPGFFDKLASAGASLSHFLFSVGKDKPVSQRARPLLYLLAAILIPAVIIIIALS